MGSRAQPAPGLASLLPLAQCQGSDLAVGAPARGGISLLLLLPLPWQGLSHLVDHKLYDELFIFILVVTDEWHGGAYHLGKTKKNSGEARGRQEGHSRH